MGSQAWRCDHVPYPGHAPEDRDDAEEKEEGNGLTTNPTLTYLSLFSGGMGGDLAMQHLLGMRCLGYVEIEEYCQKLIRQRQEDGLIDRAPIFTDIRAFVSDGYAASYTGMVDLITGGFPCQDISCAGKGAGITGERSGLWSVMADTIRIIRPRFAFVENSPMLTVRGLGTVLGDLAEMGMDARWCVLGAGHIGAWHLRERLWLVASDNIEERIQGEWGKPIYRKHGVPWSQDVRSIEDLQGRSDIPEPLIRGVRAGVAHYVDRISAIGNGQVPVVAATAWRILNGCRSW